MRVPYKKTKRGRAAVLAGRLVLLAAFAAAAVGGIFFFRNRRTAAERSDGAIEQAFSFRTEEGSGLLSDFYMESAEGFTRTHVASEPYVALNDFHLQGEGRGLLFDIDSHRALFADGIYDRLYPASLTKIMTALLVMERGDLGTEVTITEEDLNLEEGSQVSDLEVGDTITVEGLLNILLVYSGNDVANALARTVGGSVENFVAMMNERARELGMTGTNFTNPHGLHDENSYTTPYDVYLMLQEAYSHEIFREISSQESYPVQAVSAEGEEVSYLLYSTDQFLSGVYHFPTGLSILASKTGTTLEAGSCLALVIQDGFGIPYVALIMKADSHEALYADMYDLAAQLTQS